MTFNGVPIQIDEIEQKVEDENKKDDNHNGLSSIEFVLQSKPRGTTDIQLVLVDTIAYQEILEGCLVEGEKNMVCKLKKKNIIQHKASTNSMG